FGGTDIVAAAWVGFNQGRSLGRNEQGGLTAIPIWTDFMQEALEGVPERWVEEPPGIRSLRINPANGLRASASNPNAVIEKFRMGTETESEPDDLYRTQQVPGSTDSP